MNPPSFSDPQGFWFFLPSCLEESLSFGGRRKGWGAGEGKSTLDAETTDIFLYVFENI